MIEGYEADPLMVPPGRERRALMRVLKTKIGTDDFSEQEWAEIVAELARESLNSELDR